ncbi:hypothetical protein B0H14DRAFT_2960585, partial [Mycena olivaceomarginata]
SILMFSSCIFFCTVLNLQLVLVHHINGNSMEKFYYIGSVAVVAILNITPYAAGQFGYYYGTCWFNDPRPDVQFRWLLGSQSVWILLMSTGEVVFFFMILAYMYRMRKPRGMSTSSTSFSTIPQPAIVVYRAIILRIGLYPLLSCCLSFTGCIVDIWLTKNPDPTELVCAILFSHPRALSITFLPDHAPSHQGFLRALRALRNHSKSKHSTGATCSSEYTNSESHGMNRLSKNSRAPVHVQLGQEKKSTTWEAESKKEASFVEPEPVQSMLSLVDREREGGEELDVEAQTRSRAEDIARQI